MSQKPSDASLHWSAGHVPCGTLQDVEGEGLHSAAPSGFGERPTAAEHLDHKEPTPLMPLTWLQARTIAASRSRALLLQ
eukprot:4730994-Pyramimonas_sp.AAC.1